MPLRLRDLMKLPVDDPRRAHLKLPSNPAGPVVPTGDLLRLNNSTNNSNTKELEYAVVANANLEVFVDIVENMIEEGWKLHGGLAVDSGRFYQAFVKYNIPSRNKELSAISMGGMRSSTRKNRRRAN